MKLAPFVAVTAPILPGRLSIRFWSACCNLCPSVRSGADGGENPAHNLCFNSLKGVFIGVEVRVLCRSLEFFHSKLAK